MAETWGYDSDYDDQTEYASGTSTDTQYAIKLTAPEDGIITRIGGYCRGYSGDTSARFCIWGTGNALQVKSELVTLDSAAVSPTAGLRYIGDATTEWTMTDGTDYYVGVSRNPNGGMQVPSLDNGGDHYDDNAASIAASFNATLHNGAGRLAMFALYEPALPEVYVRRSGAWSQLQESYVRRSSAWTAIGPEVYVRRSGVWVAA